MIDEPELTHEELDEERELEDLLSAELGFQDVRADVIKTAQAEGIKLAYGAAKAVLEDKTASPLARLTASKIVLDIGRQKVSDREDQPVAPEDETVEQFERRYAKARAHAAAMEREEARRKLEAVKASKTTRGSGKLKLFD